MKIFLVLIFAAELAAAPSTYTVYRLPAGPAPVIDGDISEWNSAYFIDSLRSDSNILARDNTTPWVPAEFQYEVYMAWDSAKIYFALKTTRDEAAQLGTRPGCDDAYKINPGGQAAAFYIFFNGQTLFNPSTPYRLGSTAFIGVNTSGNGPNLPTVECSLDRRVLDPFGMGMFQLCPGFEEGDTPDCMDTHYGGIGVEYIGNKQDWSSSQWDNPLYFPTFVCSDSTGPLPPAGISLVPVQDPATERRPVFRWHSVENASVYTLQADTLPGFGNPILIVSTVDTFYLPLADMPVGPIYWRLASDAQPGQYSEIQRFTIIGENVPVLCRFGGSEVNTGLPVFQWHPVDTAAYYRLQIDDSRDFSDPVITLNLADTLFASMAPFSDGSYFWRVSTNGDPALYSPADSLIVRVAGRVEGPGMSEAHALIEAYPNPFNPRINILFNAGPAVEGTVNIYGVDGRILLSRSVMGQERFTWDAGGLPSGVYLLKARAAGRTLSRKLILAR